MNSFHIILFVCNWGPHSAFQKLQDESADIPAEVKMVRIPCAGRISKALLIKAFEMGADGVMLAGCHPGACRYGSGTESARQNTEDAREILELLGLKKDRVRFATFLPDDSEAMLRLLKDFSNEIKRVGKSPVIPTRKPAPGPIDKKKVAEVVAAHDIFACQDCGKCSSACSLAQMGKPFSPRVVANSVIAGDIESPTVIENIWACLTCGLCYERCPSAVNFPEFIRDVRHVLSKSDRAGHETHGGFFQSMMRTLTSPDLKPEHWEWLPNDIRSNPDGKVLFFGGCAPYFDIFFRRHLGVRTRKILVDSLRLLNFFDIEPALLSDERCCGHDLLWSGDQENFLKLAALNVESFHHLGIEEVITTCPECYRTLKHDYPEHGVEINFKVTHLYEIIEKEISKGAVDFKKMDQSVTFQDACRLSRMERMADLPRKLLSRLKPKGFQEMKDHANAAVCCGNCSWIGCDSFSKALQVQRLRQAHDTGSNLLVTACPKCQIHLQCAMEDPFIGEEIKMEVEDLSSVIARTICWE
ncbi:MAG TPA: hydrogenase iron-sulfur subunit [Desulfobacterales bacterium]|nr:hydrogenase iron-sulfur subunit [Desulfobacterales bacterium]